MPEKNQDTKDSELSFLRLQKSVRDTQQGANIWDAPHAAS